MIRHNSRTLVTAIALTVCWVATASAQNRGGGNGGGGGGGGGGGFANSYPQRPPGDPASVARGKGLYVMACGYCHGEDARGGDGGSNLLRSQIVIDDDKGESIGNVVRNGIDAMPKMEFTDAQLADIAAFIHSFRVAGYDNSRQRPSTIVVGDAKAGETYFRSKCGSCHQATGDLKGFAARYQDPRALQQWWLMPGGTGARGVNPKFTSTVTVTQPSGEK